MEVKHTPGPWKVGRPTNDDGTPVSYRHISTRDDDFGDLATIWSAGDDTAVEANAMLIAAAPVMLAALKDADIAVEQLCDGQDAANECWNILRAIRAAIAKATAS